MTDIAQATDSTVAIIALADEIARITTGSQISSGGLLKGNEIEYLLRFRAAYAHLRGTVLEGRATDDDRARIDEAFGTGS